MDIINSIIGCLPEFIECLPVLVFAFISPLLLCCLLVIAFVIIDKWIDILFYPLVIIGDIMNKRRQQKDIESWWKENKNSQEDDK
jgi:hypothetical protein